MSRHVPFLDLQRQIAEQREVLDAAFDRVLRSGQVLLGEELASFEREFAAWNGVPHAVGVSSGCDAIALLLLAAGIGRGDEVIVPAFTCPATWMGVCQAGATPVPAEVDPTTALLDPAAAEAAVTPATRAILAVHLYGTVCPLEPLRAICRRHGLRLFIDAAQSTGATWEGSRAAALADGAAFSFYPTKNLGALDDAGCVVTPHGELAEAARSLRNYGKDAAGLHQRRGINARMGELQSAVLRARLRWVDGWNQRRVQLAGFYLRRLRDLPGLLLPPDSPGAVRHLFAIRLAPPMARDRLAADLRNHGVGTAVHYRETFATSPAFRDDPATATRGPFPTAETFASTVLSLPLHPGLREDEADYVCRSLESCLTPRGG
jgi:dTDP-4-amino-4,6-dideoxygalactose transaminase